MAIKETTLFVSIGTHEERDAAETVLRSEGSRYVLDLLTIAELVRRKAFEPAIRVLGTPLVPHTLREHLLILQQLAAGPRRSVSLSESEGNLQLTETPDAYYDQQERLLSEILTSVDKYCEVVPTFGPKVVTGVHRTLAQAVDADTLDSLYLAAERDAVLISEDGALRLLSPEASVRTSMGIQPVLMEACRKGFLSQDTYANIIMAKLGEGHDFVSVRAEDLLTLAKRTPAYVADDVRLALESLRKPTLDIVSGIQVVSEFLKLSIGTLQLTTVAGYGKLALDVLQHGRPELAEVIHRAVARSLEIALSRYRKLNSKEQRLFATLLAAPKRPQLSFKLTPIAYAIRSLISGRRR